MVRKYYHITAIVFFCAVLFGIPICFLFEKHEEFSESENRYLADKPSVSAENILSGKFMEDTEKYIDDHFPQRAFWISFKSDFLRFIGNREINNVYLSEDDYLIEKWLTDEFDENQLEENTEALNYFAQKHPDQSLSIMLIPTAGMILNYKLPENAPMFNQQVAYDFVKNRLNGISFIDINPLFMSHGEEALYYKTDHHWTTYGAFLAYSAWREANGSSVSEKEFEIETVTENFQGSLHSKVLGSFCDTDIIEVYKRKEEAAYCVEYNFGKAHTHTVYAEERLLEKDKYQFFLNGNHPEVVIRTEQTNGKHLLIIKDSFANAFIPFLLNDYDTIHIIDLRYFNGSIDDYVLNNNINEYLFLYNIKNFCEDKNICTIMN